MYSYRDEMHVYSPVFQGQLIEKKIRSITFIVCSVQGRVEKNAKKGKKNAIFLFNLKQKIIFLIFFLLLFKHFFQPFLAPKL